MGRRGGVDPEGAGLRRRRETYKRRVTMESLVELRVLVAAGAETLTNTQRRAEALERDFPRARETGVALAPNANEVASLPLTR